MFNFFLIDKKVFYNSIKNYKIFVNIYFNNKNRIFLLNSYTPKFNWLRSYTSFNKINFSYLFFNLKTTFSKNFNLKKNNNQRNDIYDIVKIKRKASIFKKNSDHQYLVLNYINQLKLNYEKIIMKNNKHKLNRKKKIFFQSKNIDLSRNLKLMFKNNRKILKSFFELKYYRNFSLSKNIKKIANFNKINMLFSLEYNLINVLMKTDMFISLKDCIWFLDNSLVSVNSKIINNKKYIIKAQDIINLSYNYYYYKFYKESFHKALNNLYKINLKLWSINRNRSKMLDSKENYPTWMDNFKSFKKDIPINLEVDYVTMSIVVLYIDFKVNNITYINLKFINFYLNRLYNWKYII